MKESEVVGVDSADLIVTVAAPVSETSGVSSSPPPGIPSPAAGERRDIGRCSCEESNHLRAAIAHIARLVNQEDFDRVQLAFDVNMIIAAALCLLPLPPEE